MRILKQPFIIAIAIMLLMLSVFQEESHANRAYLQNLQESINQAIASVRPSVVNITARKQMATENVPIWYNSIGSGIIIDSKGYILSNYHVIEDAVSIDVTLWHSRQKQFKATIVDQDTGQDMVVLSIQAAGEQLMPAQMGNSDTIEVGDWVISIGSPFGFSHSVSLGIVSDINRNLKIGNAIYENMIQTDSVINQGNSGGPLVDINGMVIGIGTAIFAPSGTYQGIGFAIPINRAKHFYSQTTGAVPKTINTPFSITDGIHLAAMPQTKKIPINLNKPIPNDITHQKFSDCTNCHVISQKMTVNMNKKMTHPSIDNKCSTCHILINEPVLKGPTPVAAVTPLTQGPKRSSFYDIFMQVIIKLIPVILVSSIIFTMLGVGGGFLYVPVLLVCGIDFHTATSTSLIIITMSQLSALYIFYKSGLVDVKLIILLGLPTMGGAFVGGLQAQNFNVQLLSIMFACTLFLASYFMMKDKISIKKDGGIFISNWISYHECNGYNYYVDQAISIPLTMMVGYMGGMLGMGGGWLMVPIMVVIFNIPMKIAVAASAMMVPITAFSGFLGHSIVGHVDVPLAVSLSITSIIGAQIGARLSIDTESNLLRFLFAFVLSLVGLWMIIRIF